MGINFNKFCVVDFETTGLGEGRQPVSIGAVMIDPRKLEICDNGIFYSTINIIEDENVEKYNLDKLEQKALEKNKLSLEDIQKSPPLKKVWQDFVNWVNFHNPEKNKWNAPIFTGYNIDFDLQIIKRIMYGHLNGQLVLKEKLLSKKTQKESSPEELAKYYKNIELIKEPWGFGPDWLFHPALKVDVLQLCMIAFESLREPTGHSMDALKGFLGFTSASSHNALIDCLWTSEVLIRFLKIQREVSADTDFETQGQTILPIQEYIDSFT